MKKRREMIENKTPRDHIEYVEIRSIIKRKVRGDEIRETIEASKSLKRVSQKYIQPEAKPDDNTTGQTRQRDPRTRLDHETNRIILLRII